MALPNEDRTKVIVGPTETIASPVINRATSRLHQNDLYLNQFIGKVAIDDQDVSAIINQNAYLTDKIAPGSGVTIETDTTAAGQVMRIYASLSAGTITSGIQVSGVVADGDIAVWEGSTGGFIRSSGLAASTLSGHLVDYTNPHDVSLSSLIDTDLSGVQNGDIISLSGSTWVPIPNPFDPSNIPPTSSTLSGAALLSYGESSKRGGFAASSKVKVIENPILQDGKKYAYLVFTTGDRTGATRVIDANVPASVDSGVTIGSRHYNSGGVADSAEAFLEFKHIHTIRYPSSISLTYYTSYTFQSTFVYDTGAFIPYPAYTSYGRTSNMSLYHTQGTTLNYLEVLAERAAVDAYKGGWYIYIFEVDKLKAVMGSAFNDPIGTETVFHTTQDLWK
jgi:hypothetical protein